MKAMSADSLSPGDEEYPGQEEPVGGREWPFIIKQIWLLN